MSVYLNSHVPIDSMSIVLRNTYVVKSKLGVKVHLIHIPCPEVTQ